MALNTQRLTPLHQAKARRSVLPQYLDIGVSRSLLIAVIMLCLMSLIVLGQTGVVATKGYAIVELEAQKTTLLRERSQLQYRYAEAQELKRIHARAQDIGLNPAQSDQIRYITLTEDDMTHVLLSSEDPPHTEEQQPATEQPVDSEAQPATEQPPTNATTP